MKKQIYEVDKSGHIKEIHLKEFNENGECIDELAENMIQIRPPNGLYRPRLIGIEWVEDMTQEEIEELYNYVKEPSENEILQDYILDIDYKLILMELGGMQNVTNL